MQLDETSRRKTEIGKHQAMSPANLTATNLAVPVESIRPQKRSFSIRGHRTSLSLETTFWLALQRAAKEDNIPVAALVTRIDADRGLVGLSSSIRVYLFNRFCSPPVNQECDG